MRTSSLLLLIVVVFFSGTLFAEGKRMPFPQGEAFPLGLYSIDRPNSLQMVRQDGWNIAQTYLFSPRFVTQVQEANLFALGNLPPRRVLVAEKKIKRFIGKYRRSAIAWWNFPEELRFWKKREFRILQQYSAWIEKYDRKRRPRYMYIPSHYDGELTAPYVPYLDVIPATVYSRTSRKPHSWVRWKVTQTVEAVEKAGFATGSNYRQGEKVVVAVLELFTLKKGKPAYALTPEGAYHDFWQSIVSGAKGVLLFSYFRKQGNPQLEQVWEQYREAALQLGQQDIGKAILYGTSLKGISTEVLKGPKMTRSFRPWRRRDSVQLSCIDVLLQEYASTQHLIVVNSCTRSVTFKLSNIPGVGQFTRLFRAGNLEGEGTEIRGVLPKLGVGIYQRKKLS